MTTKNSHSAFWFVPSFYSVNIVNNNDMRSLFVGMHKPRNLEKMKYNPEIEDLKPKADLSVCDSSPESIPFPAYYIPRLVSAVSTISKNKNIIEDVKQYMNRSIEEVTYGTSIYVERNFHEITQKQMVEASIRNNNYYKYYNDDPKNRPNHTMWLSGAYIYYERPVTKNEIVIGSIQQLIVIGKDELTGNPLIGFKKSYDNYSTIVPLVDDGFNFLFSLIYMVYNKPNVNFISEDYLEQQITEWNLEYYRNKIVNIDIMHENISDIINKMS